MRSNGILCPLSMLPSECGIGDFGKPSYEFIKLIKEAGIKYWQILPLNPSDSFNSPYASSCDSAFDPIYVSLDLLVERGLIKSYVKRNFDKDHVEYQSVREYKMFYLKKAYKVQKDTETKAFKDFIKNNTWLEKYAKFMVLSKKNHGKVLFEWVKNDRNAFYDNSKNWDKYESAIKFIYWVQFELYREFDLLKKALKEAGIILIGDMPFYVGLNSSDYFAHLDNFVIDENEKPKLVAGVPPDYFCPEGQLWGNPIYDVRYMAENGYAFFLNRIKKALAKYDILRLDHFRAFDTYYEIPYGAPNAINGTWKEGLGAPFFDLLKKEGLLDRIIVEDLGDLFPSVLTLRDKFNMPGMNILEFTWGDNLQQPVKNQVIYTGTHDNETIVGYYKNLDAQAKRLLDIKFRYNNIPASKQINMRFIMLAYAAVSDLAIIPIQDFLGIDNRGRINTPGVGNDRNWTFRLPSLEPFKNMIPTIKELLEKYDR